MRFNLDRPRRSESRRPVIQIRLTDDYVFVGKPRKLPGLTTLRRTRLVGLPIANARTTQRHTSPAGDNGMRGQRLRPQKT